MGPELLKLVGPRKALHLLSILGQEINPKLHSVKPSRRSAFRFAFGALAGAAALTGIPRLAIAKPSFATEAGTPLPEETVVSLLQQALAGTDARNAFAQHCDLTALCASLEAGNSNHLQVMGHQRTANGVTEQAVAILDEENHRILRYATKSSHSETFETQAVLFSSGSNDDTLVIEALSVNGEVPKKLSEEEEVQGVRAGTDPCGGCRGVGPGTRDKRALVRCNTKLDLGCVLSFAGCVGCAAACAKTIGLGCLFCLTTSCGGFIASGACCTGDGKTHTECWTCSAM